jgi:hypothetical protein
MFKSFESFALAFVIIIGANIRPVLAAALVLMK